MTRTEEHNSGHQQSRQLPGIPRGRSEDALFRADETRRHETTRDERGSLSPWLTAVTVGVPPLRMPHLAVKSRGSHLALPEGGMCWSHPQQIHVRLAHWTR